MQNFDEDDKKLAAVFATVAEPMADAGFTSSVMRRIRRRELGRAWALGSAGLLGLVVMLWLWDAIAVAGLLAEFAAWTTGWQALGAEIPLAAMLGMAVAGAAMTTLLTE